MEGRTYLEDGVYAFFTGSGVTLLTDSMSKPTNEIHLEIENLETLNKFMRNQIKLKRAREIYGK